ncbi:DUF4130 domain-containing protein [Flavobacteriaceae bacterium D16]|nr:DUF4130 domain-containing protein [Flavobacteriaceae bacterium D16]
METGVTLIYDGSFNGFLSAVYHAFDRNMYVTNIVKEENYQKDIFSKSCKVITDLNKAKRVWYKLRDKHYDTLKNLYFAFLSETTGIEIRLYHEIVCRMGRLPLSKKLSNNYGLGYLEDIVEQVSREKRKWEASINLDFPQGKPPLAQISPRFNILPLISRYFRLTYSSSPWIIYDQRRNYGIYFDGLNTQLISEIPQHFKWAVAA